MNLEPYPIVNGCYVSDNNQIYKVKLVSMEGTVVRQVIVEDIEGFTSRWNPGQWDDHRLIPFCLAFDPSMVKSSQIETARLIRKRKDKHTLT